ncbi:MAG: hypothetical protein IPK28_09215 [Devosia sp.]|nr:hypothetical protein [Devosia sp.]
MNVHKNARLTPRSSALLVQRIDQGWSMARAAEAVAACQVDGLSLAGVVSWTGDRQLADRSSALASLPVPAGGGANRADRATLAGSGRRDRPL